MSTPINRIVVICLLALFGATTAHAQFSKTTLNSQVSQQFPDQLTGTVTPATTRTFLNNVINSFQQDPSINPQVGTSYTFIGDTSTSSDHGKLVTFNNANPVAVTLPAASSSGFTPWNVFVRNLGTGTVTITPTTSLINGSATYTLGSGQVVWIISDGTNYQTWINTVGSVACGGLPALIGDVTTPGASCTTTVAKIAGIAVGTPTGTTNVVFSNSPTLVTPILGAATATSINGLGITTSTGTLTVANGKTETFNNTLTFSGTDSKSLTLTNSLTVNTNDGTLAFGAASKTLTINNSLTLAGTDATTLTFQGTDTYVGRATTDTLTNKTINGNNNTLTVLAASQLSGATPLANGGTGQTSAAAARASSGLNIDEATSTGDANYTILATDRAVYHTALTAPRTDTLPAATSVNPHQLLYILDLRGVASSINTVIVQRAGTDSVNGVTSFTAINATYGMAVCSTDGVSRWQCIQIGGSGGGGGGGTVTAVGSGAGLVGGTITNSGTLFVEQLTPGGRITLASATCIATTDQTAQTAVFYAPCGTGKYIPIWDGGLMELHQFTASDTDTVGLTLTLGSNWAANTLYDYFVTLKSGTVTACTVAWSNSGAGTSARATAVALFKGIWTNNASMTCRDTNTSTFTVAANQGTLVGTFKTNGNAGQVDLKFGTNAANGGTACICISNVYNQVIAASEVGDTTASWNYTTNAYRQANGQTGNQINVVQGLTGPPADITVAGDSFNTTAGVYTTSGIGIDSTSTDSSSVRQVAVSTANIQPNMAFLQTNLAAGYHNINRLESSSASGTTTFYGVVGSPAGQTAIMGRIWY